MNDSTMIKRFFIVPRKEIAYLRFTFEAYDGLVFLRTLKAAEGLIEVAYSTSRQEDAEALLTAVDLEIGLTAAERPTEDEYDVI